MSQALLALAGVATLGSALIAGAFFAFSSFIMQALGELPSAQGIAAMQRINIVVLNRSFLGTFFGTALASVAIGMLSVARIGAPEAPWFLCGGAFYFLGTFLVTALGNVPLNDGLAAVDARDPGSEQVWSYYRTHWTRLNTLRTVAAALAVASFSVGFMR